MQIELEQLRRAETPSGADQQSVILKKTTSTKAKPVPSNMGGQPIKNAAGSSSSNQNNANSDSAAAASSAAESAAAASSSKQSKAHYVRYFKRTVFLTPIFVMNS